MTKSCRICVVGSANVDLTFCTSRLPKAGETVSGRALHIGMGGKGANQAVAAARLGADVALVACVGSDSFGREAIARYQAEGIDTSFVRQDSHLPTGTAAILLDDEAENRIIVVAGANAGLTVADVKKAAVAIREADVLLCQLETPLDATLEAFRIAHAADVLTVLTPSPISELPEELLRQCDLCVLNRTEMEFLSRCPVDSPDAADAAAKSLKSRGVRFVAVTMGKHGACLLDDAGATHIPAITVDAVDTTGAGDAYTAALAVSLGCGLELRQAARRASVVAAITVTRVGTQTAFPHGSEVEEQIGAVL
ncbi:MAG: ribokinase [Planctomycetaceae bacterium]